MSENVESAAASNKKVSKILFALAIMIVAASAVFLIYSVEGFIAISHQGGYYYYPFDKFVVSLIVFAFLTTVLFITFIILFFCRFGKLSRKTAIGFIIPIITLSFLMIGLLIAIMVWVRMFSVAEFFLILFCTVIIVLACICLANNVNFTKTEAAENKGLVQKNTDLSPNGKRIELLKTLKANGDLNEEEYKALLIKELEK